MNKKQAQQKGLVFTGIYNFDKEETKARIPELKTKYPKAKFYLVTVPGDPLSRGGPRTGYSVYATEVYEAYQTLEVKERWLKIHSNDELLLKSKYEADLAEFRQQLRDMEQGREEAQNEINNA